MTTLKIMKTSTTLAAGDKNVGLPLTWTAVKQNKI